MTDDIKPLNLNTEAEVKPVADPKPAPVAAAKPVAEAKPVVSEPTKPKKKMISWFMILVLLGVGTGFGIYTLTKPKMPKKLATEAEGEVVAGDIFGVEDEEVFSDTAEGTLIDGGIDGEGSHHLEREGGKSQYVYLTSSVIDLDQFVDKKVKIWGQTFEAQKAGWLMDVGRLEIQE
jgi:hypothetical protein